MCSITGCGGAVYCKGWCRKHYTRWYRHGDPVVVQVIRGNDAARFAASYVVDPETGCHLWTENLTHKGYARFWAKGHEHAGHVWAWTEKHGSVPEGKQLDHFRCDTERCVNDEHVRPVTPRENVLRSNNPAALNAAKEVCDDGHPFDASNTRLNADGSRVCRKCELRRTRASRARRKTTQASA